MELSRQSPEYRSLRRRAEVAPCTCSGEAENLCLAAEQGCLRCCIKFMGQAGSLSNNWTALMKAAKYGNLDVVRLIMPYEIRMKNEHGQTALMKAAESGHLKVAQLLAPHEAGMQNKYQWTALMKAAFNNHVEVAKLLVPQEARKQDDYGDTALMKVARYGHADVVKVLVPYEAGMKDGQNKTALVYAAQYCQRECMRLLLKSEAEREESGMTPVMSAAYLGDISALVACQKEWRAKHLDMTALDFALLGDQQRAAHFLACHESRIRDLLPVLCTTAATRRSELFALSLTGELNMTRHLRPICTIGADLALESIRECRSESRLIHILASLKQVGFSHGRKTVLGFSERLDEFLPKYLRTNPLKWKQAELARKEAEGRVRKVKQAAWREVRAESCFNQRLLLEARDLAWEGVPASKLAPDRHFTKTREKRQICRELILGSTRAMWDAVLEMLAE